MSSIWKCDALTVLKALPDNHVQCVVTSPPYYGLRSYVADGQSEKSLEIGTEKTPDAYIANLVEIFREMRRVLRNDGTFWLNIGDSYAGAGDRRGGKGNEHRQMKTWKTPDKEIGLKAKDLIMLPARLAIALQSDGWYLRSDIIWEKPNAMPESVTDRPTTSHEHIFLFAKSAKYYYNADAIAEPCVRPGDTQTFGGNKGRAYTPTKTDPNYRGGKEQWGRTVTSGETRNKRSVWSISTKSYRGAHFATFPEKLVEPCILAGSRVGDMVLDPFCGAGTVPLVALKHGRKYIGIELNPAYIELINKRIEAVQPVLWTTTEEIA